MSPNYVKNESIVEKVELLHRLQQAADMMVGVFQEARIDLHLAAQHRLERFWHVVPSRNFFVARRELAVLRDHAELFLPSYGFFAQLVPASIELTFVLVRPFFWHMVRRMGGAGREIDEKRLVRR